MVAAKPEVSVKSHTMSTEEDDKQALIAAYKVDGECVGCVPGTCEPEACQLQSCLLGHLLAEQQKGNCAFHTPTCRARPWLPWPPTLLQPNCNSRQCTDSWLPPLHPAGHKLGLHMAVGAGTEAVRVTKNLV